MTKRRVTVKATNNTIVQVLEKMFQGTSVVWEIRDRQILLKAGEEKKTSSPTGSEHKKTIQGLVKDQGGEPLIGATVTVVGTPPVRPRTLTDCIHSLYRQMPHWKSLTSATKRSR